VTLVKFFLLSDSIDSNLIELNSEIGPLLVVFTLTQAEIVYPLTGGHAHLSDITAVDCRDDLELGKDT
jgi:hypothetical protein